MTDGQRVLKFQQEMLDWIRSIEGQDYIKNNYDQSTMSQKQQAQIFDDLVKVFKQRLSKVS